jgi:hypothetical protein
MDLWKKHHTIAIYYEVYDAHPRQTRPWVTHKSNTISRPLLLELLKVLLDFLLIGVKICAIYFPASQDRDVLT